MTIQHLVVDVAVAESLVGDNAGGVLALASVEGRKLDLPFRGQGELEPCFLNPVQLPPAFWEHGIKPHSAAAGAASPAVAALRMRAASRNSALPGTSRGDHRARQYQGATDRQGQPRSFASAVWLDHVWP